MQTDMKIWFIVCGWYYDRIEEFYAPLKELMFFGHVIKNLQITLKKISIINIFQKLDYQILSINKR